MNRTVEAFTAAQRIMDKLELAGFDAFNPTDIKDNGYNLPDDMHYNWGASRVVVWDDECDYVIKIARGPFDEKYNVHEVEVYAAAVEEGLEETFAWCACYIEPVDYGDVSVPGIYVMEFLEGDEEDISQRAYDCGLNNYCETHGITYPTSDTCDDYERTVNEDEEIMELVESTMPQHKRGLFERFLIDWNVSDIHCGNVLFRNDTYVICDYAGYGW